MILARILDKFRHNLIQKKITKRFVTSSMCMFDPIAKKLVDISINRHSLCWCSRPAGCHAKGCSANHINEDARK